MKRCVFCESVQEGGGTFVQTVKVQFSHKKFLTREKFWDIIKAQRQCNVSQIHPLLSDPWQQGLLQTENMKRYTQT